MVKQDNGGESSEEVDDDEEEEEEDDEAYEQAAGRKNKKKKKQAPAHGGYIIDEAGMFFNFIHTKQNILLKCACFDLWYFFFFLHPPLPFQSIMLKENQTSFKFLTKKINALAK